MTRLPFDVIPRACAIAALALLAAGPAAGRAPAAVPGAPLWMPPGAPPPPARPEAGAKAPAGHVPVVRAPRAAAARPEEHPVTPAATAAQAGVGSVTGLPVPRFASLRSSEVDLRAGPGSRYPIRWVYRRLGMPVEIEREFSVWREVLTPDGADGWMHEATLKDTRDGIVTGTRRVLRRAAEPGAVPVAILEPGVVLRIRRCDPGAAWCQVAVAAFHGWLPRSDFWGTFAGEAVGAR